MRVVTQNDIKKINELYLELKTYAAVARATGFSPSTIKKYVIANYTVAEIHDKIIFNKPLPVFDPTMFRTDDWGALCILSEQELEDVKILQKELEL